MRKHIARALIKLAHKVYPPKVTHFPQDWSGLDHTTPGAGSAAQAGLEIANRAIRNARYAGQRAGMGVEGLLETLDVPPWQKQLIAGIAGAPPTLPNAATKPAPSLWRRILDWFGL
ncbi:hypothetical protein A5742_25360 [Mycolicibacterium fortuitum]|uniref:Uncharacterized protein n=1 Tax=Mycolicibacterium fortuitum TaxID=1766 RepID=A0ABD6QPA1_MYCFO|nr:hypothetical protein [Mycolicibacterium fortuitum]OMC46865.1 hypothetical protein A5742_25360 [Mycolicibacterium fortuitum]